VAGCEEYGYNGRCDCEKRQCQKLAEQALGHGMALGGDVRGVVNMVQALHTRHVAGLLASVHVQRGAQQHGHEYRKEYPCTPNTLLLHMFHHCKITEYSPKFDACW
jgi:hypothetical protein